MSDDVDFAVVLCIPVDRTLLEKYARKAGVPAPRPTTLYTLTQCEVCKQDVWIGPRLLAATRIRPDLRKLCYFCAIREADRLGVTDMPLTDLGGGMGVEGEVRGG